MQLRHDARLLRATSTIARTFYRELRRADYSHQDVLRLVNEMVELLTHDARAGEGRSVSLHPTLDRETGLPNATVLREVLEFELGHTRDGQECLVVQLDVELPSVLADAFTMAVHESLAQALRRQLRASETIGRLGPNRYLIVAPRAGQEIVRPLLRRLGAALANLDALRGAATGARIVARAVTTEGTLATPEQLLERLTAAPILPVYPVELIDQPPRRVRVAGRAVTLALGGGAARALAHLGVLRVLARAGVRVAGIAGTSAGALVGALYASGLDEDAIAARFAELRRSPLYGEMRRAYAQKLSRGRERLLRASSMTFVAEEAPAALGNDLLAAVVEHFVGPDRTIQSLPIPFSACTTDLVEGRMVNLSYGSLHTALRATCALPGLFAPQPDGDRLLVDGSVVSEVPHAAAHQLATGAPVMAVYLERPVPPVKSFATSTEVAIRTSALVHTELVREQLRTAPLLLTIPVGEIGWLSFQEGADIIRLGEEAAEAALPALMARLDA